MRGVQEKNVRQAEVPTPYRVMRMQNCKTFNIPRNSKLWHSETFPSIRPPINKCFYEKTTEMMANTMQNCGCSNILPDCMMTSFKSPISQAMHIDLQGVHYQKAYNPCNDPRPIRGNSQWRKIQDRTLDWNIITPYNLMRLENCKISNFTECEIYPSIRPAQFTCNRQMTEASLYDAIEDVKCERVFDIEQDDILETWKQCPKKETLSFYGITSRIYRPEAVIFNQLLAKCLKKAGIPEKKQITGSPVRRKTTNKSSLPAQYPCGMVLNRQKLQTKVGQMPTVLKKLNEQSTINWKYCQVSKKSYEPFTDDPAKCRPVSLQAALDMEKPAEEDKHGLRRKHTYCDLICGIPGNKCTEYELMKSVLGTDDYNESYMEIKRTSELARPEPKNYEELYDELITCFVEKPCDPDMNKLLKCCTSNKGAKDDKGGDNDGDFISDGGDGPRLKFKDGTNDSKIKKKTDGDGDKEPKEEEEDVAHEGNEKSDSEKEHKGKEKKEIVPPKAQPIENPEHSGKEEPQEEQNKIQVPPKPKRNPKEKPKVKSPEIKDCPCDPCKKGNIEPDSPLITQLKKEEKRRKLKDYLKIMCFRQNQSCASTCRAPLRKCDDIKCDDCFCCDTKFHDYCECISALQELQDLLPPNEFPELRDLKRRITSRLCESL